MRPLVLAALALTGCKADAPSTVTITAQAPPVGQVAIATNESHSTETLTLQGTDLVIARDHTERRRSEVVEVSATAATKLRVTYEARTEHETADGQTREVASPLVGNTYVVWRDGAGVRAMRDGGGEVSDAEAAMLADDHVELGRMAQMEALITGRPSWKRGEAVVYTADELRDLDHAQGVTNEGTQTTAATLTLTSLERGVATFAAVLQVETDNAAVALSTRMSGTVAIEVAHARPVSIIIDVNGKGVVLGGRAAGASLQITNRGTQKYVYQ